MAEVISDETCPYIDCYNLTAGELQPYPDISGTGVLIGFIGTAYCVLLLVVLNYLLAFDPNANPFQDRHGNIGGPWKPNPIDARFISGFRRHILRGLASRLHPGLQSAFHESIVALCDIQVVTGLGILTSSFILLPCGLDAYHWQIAVYLAWFSTVTHLSGLTILRTYLSTYIWAKYVRFSLMLCLLILLLIGMVPTGLFPEYPTTAAICYFNQSYGYWRFAEESTSDYNHVEDTAAWQAMIFSVILVVFGFCTRTIKLFQPLSTTFRLYIRQPLGDRIKKYLLNLTNSSITPKEKEALRVNLIVKPIVAMLFTVRVNADSFSSALFEVYWLVVILAWGTVKLFGARYAIEHDIKDEISFAENQWTFGQILPVLLLCGPIFGTIGTFIFHLTNRESVRPLRRAVNDLSLNRTETIPLNDISTGSESDLPETTNDMDSPHTDSFHTTIPWLGDYTDAPWLPVCVGVPFFFVMVVTGVAFGVVFDIFGRLQAQDTLYELWISHWKLIYLLVTGYPCACLVTIRVGIGMEDWCAVHRKGWSTFRFVFICGIVYTAMFFFIFVSGLPVRGDAVLLQAFGGPMMALSLYLCHALYCVGSYVFMRCLRR